jgi:hypothetical protein
VLQALHGIIELSPDLRMTLLEELVEDLDFLQSLSERLVPIDLASEPGQAGVQLLAASRVIPDPGLRQEGLDPGGLLALTLEVKGTPSRWPAVRKAS